MALWQRLCVALWGETLRHLGERLCGIVGKDSLLHCGRETLCGIVGERLCVVLWGETLCGIVGRDSGTLLGETLCGIVGRDSV